MIFGRYFKDASHWALRGEVARKLDFQIHCGPALGAFNQSVLGSELAPWRARHVDELARHLMDKTAALLVQRFAMMQIPQG
jgi:trans-AT polyketide synthase/acyltransferase/oxidoreductase domain-containing protein